MGFWSKLGKIGAIAAPIVAAPFTGGLSLALIGAGAGAAGGALSGGGWKSTLLGAGIGGATGGLAGMGGGAASGAANTAKGVTVGSALKTAAKYAPTAVKAGRIVAGDSPEQRQASASPGMGVPGVNFQDPRNLGYLNPIGINPQRRTQLAGMGVRDYA